MKSSSVLFVCGVFFVFLGFFVPPGVGYEGYSDVRSEGLIKVDEVVTAVRGWPRIKGIDLSDGSSVVLYFVKDVVSFEISKLQQLKGETVFFVRYGDVATSCEISGKKYCSALCDTAKECWEKIKSGDDGFWGWLGLLVLGFAAFFYFLND